MAVSDEDVIRHLYNKDGTWDPDQLGMHKQIAKELAVCDICDAYAAGYKDGLAGKQEDDPKFKDRPLIVRQAYAYGMLVGHQDYDHKWRDEPWPITR